MTTALPSQPPLPDPRCRLAPRASSPERAAPLLHADVVLRDGRIAEIGTNLVSGPHAQRIDGSGRFLIPGLIDSHVHAGQSAALAQPIPAAGLVQQIWDDAAVLLGGR